MKKVTIQSILYFVGFAENPILETRMESLGDSVRYAWEQVGRHLKQSTGKMESVEHDDKVS